MKSLLTYLLLVLFQCWTHCSMAQYGAYMEDGGPEQAAGMMIVQAFAIHATSHHHSGTCCAVDLLTDGTTLTARIQLSSLIAAMPELLPAPPLPQAPLAKMMVPSRLAANPPWRRRLCEILARSACPVRGPAFLQA